jgi:hypothetical protein
MSCPVSNALADLQEQGWTLTAVADELGIDLLTVYRWRDGTTVPADPGAALSRVEGLNGQMRPWPRNRCGRSAPER